MHEGASNNALDRQRRLCNRYFITGVIEMRNSGPQDFRSALARIRADYRGMTPSYRGLAEYVLAHPYELVFMSAARLGTLAGSSGATVVRFSESIGLTGYAHLQRLAREAVHRHADTLSKLEYTEQLGQAGTIPDSIMRADSANLERTRSGISDANFQGAVELLSKARGIHVIGLRSNYGLANLLAFNLNMIGRRVDCLIPGVGDLPEQLIRVGKGSVIVAISFRRYTRCTVDLVQQLQARRLPIIAITDSELSPLTEMATVVLTVAVTLPSILESQTAAMSVCNALVTAVALANRRLTAKALREREEAWAKSDTYLSDTYASGFRSRLDALAAMPGPDEILPGRMEATETVTG
jgi:DNA-binding MurR/RpiR family transcriptional regulator